MGFRIVFTPGLLRPMSNSKLMRFNIFMNFDREFSLPGKIRLHCLQPCHWPLKYVLIWVSYNHCPCDQTSDSTNPRDLSEGEDCVLCQLCPGRQAFEMRKCSAIPQGRGTEALPPQHQGTPPFFCDFACGAHTTILPCVCVHPWWVCRATGLQSPVQ